MAHHNFISGVFMRVNDEPDLTLLLKVSLDKVKAEQCPHCGVRHRSITQDECLDRQMSEKTLSDRVLYRAKKNGWKHAHAGRLQLPDGRWITPMSVGWPDWTFVKPGHQIIFMELKKETAEPDPEQVEWLQAMNLAGACAIIIRPSDLREGRVDQILKYGSPLVG